MGRGWEEGGAPATRCRPPRPPILLQSRDGSSHSGVLAETATAPGGAPGLGATLRVARALTLAGGAPAPPAPPVDTLVIPPTDLLSLDAADVRVDAPAAGAAPGADFGTDAEISAGRGGRAGRELERWVPDAGVADTGALEEGGGGGGGKGPRGRGRAHASSTSWNQFAENEAKFGVRTDYRDEFYTTAVDVSKAGISLADADRIAREIERGAKVGGATTAHQAEERGVELPDDVDEEALYSSVQRGPAAPPRQKAWAAPGAGVAAVAGASRATAPVDVDLAKQVRASLAAGGRGRAGGGASPYGTPTAASVSPLAAAAAASVAALDLNPGTARVPADVTRDFSAFKAAENARRAAAAAAGRREALTGAAPAAPAPAAPASPKPTDASKSALNPNAKAFSFNPAATEFRPASAAAPAAAGAAAAAAAAASATSAMAAGRGRAPPPSGGGWPGGRPGSPGGGRGRRDRSDRGAPAPPHMMLHMGWPPGAGGPYGGGAVVLPVAGGPAGGAGRGGPAGGAPHFAMLPAGAGYAPGQYIVYPGAPYVMPLAYPAGAGGGGGYAPAPVLAPAPPGGPSGAGGGKRGGGGGGAPAAAGSPAPGAPAPAAAATPPPPAPPAPADGA